jgi:hypothetical protein
MKPESSLLYSYEPVTGQYPEADDPVHTLQCVAKNPLA